MERQVYELRLIEEYFGDAEQFGSSFGGYAKEDRPVAAVPIGLQQVAIPSFPLLVEIR